MIVKNRSNTPWYIWLSFLALMLLWGDTARRIKVSRKNFIDDFPLWGKACLNIAKISILYFILPLALYAGITGHFFEHLVNEPIYSDVFEAINLVVLYLSNVYASHRHVVWRNKNISHLLGSEYRRNGIIARILRHVFPSKYNIESPTDNEDTMTPTSENCQNAPIHVDADSKATPSLVNDKSRKT